MTGRENALHVLLHDGKAEYIPSIADFDMIMATDVVRERPPTHWVRAAATTTTGTAGGNLKPTSAAEAPCPAENPAPISPSGEKR